MRPPQGTLPAAVGRIPRRRVPAPGTGRPSVLLGRRPEREELDRLLADVVAGTSRVLVLRGEAGAGKSALLDHVAARMAGWRVTTAVGVESETDLAYSGLHQLCAPLLPLVERLPPPQRAALETVFGLSSGPAPDRFLVSLATVNLVAEGAADQPLGCIVDDAQWLDPASAQVLAFVARRLAAERVALVCATRPGTGDEVFPGHRVLPVRGLGDADARALLLRRLHAPLDAAVCDQIIAESRGNPLALLELPRGWSTRRLAGGFGLTDGRPVAGLIEQSYVRRSSLLPPGTRLLVLAAAAEPRGDPALLQRAATTLGIGMEALVPAADEGLLRVGGRVEFAHPLVRSAVYGAADPDDRRRVHRALAEATDAQEDPDRRAWHRARGTSGPDEDVAGELERSAGRARARGGLAAAAAFLARATELTADPGTRARRAVAAASAHVQAGAFDSARALLTLGSEAVDDLQRARVDLLGAQLAFASRRDGEAPALLLAAARRLEPHDLGLARETYLDALSAALFVGRTPEGICVQDVARAALAAPRAPGDEPAVVDLLVEALAALLMDDATALRLARAALERLARDPRAAEGRMRWLWLGSALAAELWDDESWDVLSERYLRAARSAGALGEVPHAADSRAAILLVSGEVGAAAALIDEARAVRQATGVSEAPYASSALAAWQGRADEARETIDRAVRESAARGDGWGVSFGEYARALLCNGLGQHDDALVAARRARQHSARRGVNLGLPELIEAAARSGRPDLAAGALDELSAKARASGSDWGCGIAARSRALLTEGAAAEDLFRTAIEHLGRTRIRGELARSHLLYGEWLRRTDRRSDARGRLALAYELFTDMGMDGFAGRARRELQATGVTVPRARVATGPDLTAQEAQIAHLAREGLSNPEIGAQLFLSARTVEWHLRKVFAKLGVTSRRQLRQALAEPGTASS